MAYLSRLRAATRGALRVIATAVRPHTRPAGSECTGSVLLSQAASPGTQLRRADAHWQAELIRMRVEIMASGPFESLRGIRHTVNRLQNDIVAAGRGASIELRLMEVRPACCHSTAWSLRPVDPGASTTAWECLVDDEFGPKLTLFEQAFRDSLRHHVNHIVMFGDRFDDGLLRLGSVVRAFRQRGVRISTLYLGDDFNGRNMYHFLAASTGGLFMKLSGPSSLDAALPAIAAFACGDHSRLAALSANRTLPGRPGSEGRFQE